LWAGVREAIIGSISFDRGADDVPYLFDRFDMIRDVLAWRPAGLFTDVDGTISRIAPTPAEAVVSESCRESLGLLVQRLEVVAAVSGRSAVDTKRMVGVEGMVYVGNHGYERLDADGLRAWPGTEEYPDKIGTVLKEFSRHVSIEGMVVENKGPTASIHYRRCSDHEAARRAITAAIDVLARENGLKVSAGKLVVELRPPLDVTKGSGILSLAAELGLRGAVYIGDDLTDVDVFVALHRTGPALRGLGVGVVGDETPPEVVREADLTLNGVDDVERFLRQAAAEAAGRPAS
jgi:trehalose 6-phosphate phosphatase